MITPLTASQRRMQLKTLRALLLWWVLTVTAASSWAQQAEQDTVDTGKPVPPQSIISLAGLAAAGFYLADPSDNSHGGVIIVPDMHRQPTLDSTVNALRHNLADNHWHTLAIDISQSSPEQSLQIIGAAVSYLNQQGVYNVAIIGIGVGAAQAVHYTASIPAITRGQGAFEPIRAVLMINANNTVPGSDADTLKQLGLIRVQVLDIFLSNNFKQKKMAKARTQVARKALGRRYQQALLPPSSGLKQDADNRISKRIRGWLDNNVTGFMVDRKAS